MVDVLSTNDYHTESLQNSEDEKFIDPLIDRFKVSDRIYHNVRAGAPIVIWFGEFHSSLKRALIAYLGVEDITLILFSLEVYLWQWLDLNSSLTVASLILQPTARSEELITQSHAYPNVRSILVRCVSADVTRLQRYSRSYSRVDGVFDDDTRLLIKLVADLTLFSEELGDRQRDDKKNQMNVHRNYDRALKLCVLIQRF